MRLENKKLETRIAYSQQEAVSTDQSVTANQGPIASICILARELQKCKSSYEKYKSCMYSRNRRALHADALDGLLIAGYVGPDCPECRPSGSSSITYIADCQICEAYRPRYHK